MSLYSIVDIVSCLLCRLKASFNRCATMREPNVESGASIDGSSEEEDEGEEQDLSESEGGIVWLKRSDTDNDKQLLMCTAYS